MERLVRLRLAGQRARAGERHRARGGARDHAAVLPERLPETLLADRGRAAAGAPCLGAGFNLDDHLRALERELVRRALEQAGGTATAGLRSCSASPRAPCAT